MDNYEMIVFYQSVKEEVSAHAEALSGRLNLKLRYEQYPRNVKMIRSFVTEHTVFCMFNRDSMGFRKLLKYVYRVVCPALLFSSSDALDSYTNLKLPVGYLSENKEKVAWANFLLKRSYSTCLELIIPEEKDRNIRDMVYSNVHFIENVLDNSKSCYARTYAEKGFEDTLRAVMKKTDKGVLILMRPFRVFSFYIPLNLRIYRHYGHTQVILIPRDDELYVPCH